MSGGPEIWSAPVIVSVLAGVAVALLAIPVGRWLERTTYRKPDEEDLPSPGSRWWVSPVMGLSPGLVIYRLWTVQDPRAVPGWPVALVLTVTLLLAILASTCLAAMDMDVHRLPDRIMWPTMGMVSLGLLTAAVVGGAWQRLGAALLGAVACGAFYLALAWLSMARGSLGIGLGDVKLGIVLGGLLGWFGRGEVVLGLFSAFLASGLFALVQLAAGKVRRDGHFALAAPMMLGALMGGLFGAAARGIWF